MATAASLAAGVILIPTTAHAADASPAVAGKLTGTTAGIKPASGFKTYTSPASKSVRKQSTKISSAVATPDVANPNLAVALNTVPTTALGVQLTSDVTSADTTNTLSIAWGDGQTTTASAAGGTSVVSTHSYATVGDYTITVTVTDSSSTTASNSVEVITAGSDYTAYGPIRLLDTRIGLGAPQAKLTSAAPVQLQITGNGKIPSYVTAVAVNLTVTDTTGGSGYITAYPDSGGTPPTVSNLNYVTGQTVANLAIVPVGADGKIDFAKGGSGSADLIADIAGFFTQTASSGYTAQSPTRILDTRNATGAPQVPLSATNSIKLQVAGVGGVPVGATAVSLNLTLTDSTGGGYITAYPDGGTVPTASNMNYGAGQTIANAAIVPIGKDGYIDLVKGGPGSVDMLADVEGYFSSAGASAYLPYGPLRLFDSRDPTTAGKLPAGSVYQLPIATDGRTHAALTDITTVVLNTTVTDTTGNGYLTVFPDNANGAGGSILVPNASNLNFRTGNTVPNLTFATPGGNGWVDFYNGGKNQSLDLIVDMSGYFQND